MSSMGGDWLSGRAYDYFDQLDQEKIAHEFLRRNDQYAADYATLAAAPATAEPAPALTRWGLRFRGRPPLPLRPGPGRLAAAGRPAPGAADRAP